MRSQFTPYFTVTAAGEPDYTFQSQMRSQFTPYGFLVPLYKLPEAVSISDERAASNVLLESDLLPTFPVDLPSYK